MTSGSAAMGRRGDTKLKIDGEQKLERLHLPVTHEEAVT